jgi:transcriptional regulator with XRE-family HTH domain
MRTRKLQESLSIMPENRRTKIAERGPQCPGGDAIEELRKARQMTQVRLAEALGVNQSEVSRIEDRADLYLSTLSEHVEALGGKSEIRDVFPVRATRTRRSRLAPQEPAPQRLRRSPLGFLRLSGPAAERAEFWGVANSHTPRLTALRAFPGYSFAVMFDIYLDQQ